LSLDGEAELRYSREPLTLYKVKIFSQAAQHSAQFFHFMNYCNVVLVNRTV
jgi:hypothetical protein